MASIVISKIYSACYFTYWKRDYLQYIAIGIFLYVIEDYILAYGPAITANKYVLIYFVVPKVEREYSFYLFCLKSSNQFTIFDL